MPERYPNMMGGVPMQQPPQQGGGMMDILSALLPALMGMSGGGQNPLAALLGGGQQGPQAQMGMGDIQRLLMLQGMQQSPFYQGQYGPGAGAQIAGALMPFLMARAQAPLLQQQMQQAQQKQQIEALKIYFDALASQNEMALTKAKTKTEGARAEKYATEAAAIPAELMQKAELQMQKMGLDRDKFRSLDAYRQAQIGMAQQAMQNTEAYRSKKLAQGSGQQRGILKPVGDGEQQEWVLFDPITGKSVSTGRRAPKAAGPYEFLSSRPAGAGPIEPDTPSLFERWFGGTSGDATTTVPEAQKTAPNAQNVPQQGNRPATQALRGQDPLPGARDSIDEYGKPGPKPAEKRRIKLY